MSIRVELTSCNMDLVMNTVRRLGINPSDAVNLLLGKVKTDAESSNGVEKGKSSLQEQCNK